MSTGAEQRPFGDRFQLTLITADPITADRADRAGVGRIGVDLERLGKSGRQAGLDTRLSDHTIEQLAAIAGKMRHAHAFVRVNPLNRGSGDEVENVLRAGARHIMLPFFQTPAEVEAFVALVRGRARVIILIETAAALVRIRSILAVPGVDEVMAGLNDLRLSLGVSSHFEVLTSPVIDMVAQEVRNAGLPLSIGGVARPDQSSLPVPADLVLAQYPRLNATGAWLSRSFHNNWPAGLSFAAALAALRQRLTEWSLASPEALEQARAELNARAQALDSRNH